MENNEITVAVDVKMDLKERRTEFHQYRNWTRTTLRIEAIKCFPCYVKITFIHMSPSPHMPTVNNVVNINLPGLTCNLATSRTKQHTYGLFWKNNRNRCCIYLAFDSAEQCARHHHWMQSSVRNLDLHRREILETRRASRCERYSIDGCIGGGAAGAGGNRSTASSSWGPRFNDTTNILDLNEILGPLPALPDSSGHWSRRISGVSGIYEEIADQSVVDGGASNASATGAARAARKLSRASVASGIYEVMRAPMQSIRELVPPSPPPLPPRSRTFTNQEVEFKRSYTNPDADTFARHRNQLQLKPGGQSAGAAVAVGIDRGVAELKLLCSSSPDLTKITPVRCAPQTADDPSTSDSSAASIAHSMQELCTNTLNKTDPLSIVPIQPQLLTNPSTPVAQLIDCASGYCAMAPILASAASSPAAAVPSQAYQPNEALYMSLNSSRLRSDTGCTASIDSTSTIGNRQSASSGSDAENQHITTIQAAPTTQRIPLTGGKTPTADTSPPFKSPLRSTSMNHHNVVVADRSVRRPTAVDGHCFTTPPPPSVIRRTAHIKQCASEPRRPVATARPPSLSVDEKLPSYHPNPSFLFVTQRHSYQPRSAQKAATSGTPKSTTTGSQATLSATKQRPTKQQSASADLAAKSTPPRPAAAVSVLSSPERTSHRNRTPSKCTPRQRQVANRQSAHQLSKSPVAQPAQLASVVCRDENRAQLAQADAGNGAVPRPTASTIEKSSSKMSELGSNLKRFASLPRFRKLNFSPLKLKLNSVLQR